MPPKKKPSEPIEEFNCPCCDRPDSASDMVQCDQCKAWIHFSCANVNASIQDKSFLCQICQGKSMSVACFSGAGSESVVGWGITQANLRTSGQLLQSPLATTTTIFSANSEAAHVNANITTTPLNLTGSLMTPIRGSVNLDVPKSPAYSATDVAAMRGNPTTATTFSPTDPIVPRFPAHSATDDSRFPAYSATDVAAMRGGLAMSTPISSVQPHTLRLPAFNVNELFATGENSAHQQSRSTSDPVTISAISGHSAAEAAAVCGNSSAFIASTANFRQQNNREHFHSVLPPCTETLHSYASTSMTYSHNLPLPSFRSKTNIQVMRKAAVQEPVSSQDCVIETSQQLRFKAGNSTSPKGSSNKRLQIELQKIEEERQLREIRDRDELSLRRQRDAEYISKKYKMMSLVLGSSDDEGEIAHVAKRIEENNVAVTSARKWNEGISENGYLHSTTNTEAHSSQFMTPMSQHLPIYKPWSDDAATQPMFNAGQQPSGLAATTYHPQFVKASDSALLPNRDHQRPSFIQDTNNCFQAPVPPPHRIQQQPSVCISESLSRDRQNVFDNAESMPSNYFLTKNNTAVQPSVQNNTAFMQQPRAYDNTQEIMHSNSFLTKNNLAARQLIRDLPVFDGDPSEWPLFIASFNRSTELGRFSDEENLIRLHKALRGCALEAVRSLIIQPNCVGRVIKTLKMLYGRPELIINTLIRKISSTPPPKAEKLETIVTFAIAVQNLCATVEACGATDHLSYPMLTQELVEKLPPSLRLNWAIYKQSLTSCTLVHFSRWMYSLAEAANGVLATAPFTYVPERKEQKRWKDKAVVNTHYIESTVDSECCICGGACASVSECKKFQEANRTDRWEEVRKHKLCRKCLKQHLGRRCQSESVCGEHNCTLKHHRLLHNDRTGYGPQANGTVSVHSRELSDGQSFKTDPVLFRIVPVFLYGKETKVKTFAFLDDGSSVTLIDKELAEQLNVRGTPRSLCLKWTGNTSRYESDSELINLQISSTMTNAEKFQLTDIHTVNQLCLPKQTLNPDELKKKFEHLKGLNLAAYDKAAPRLLIGVNNAQLGFPLKSKEGFRYEPVATKTRLGWVIHGRNSEREQHPDTSFSLHACECNGVDLDSLVKNFICDDNFGTQQLAKVSMSDEDSRALDLLQKHTIRKNGRFETALLWRFDTVELPDSYPMARKRLLCLQKRMQRDPALTDILNNKIREYVEKGYARKITDQEKMKHQERSWYLPVFPVENANKPGKIRLVWDAAAAVHGTSLNSLLLKGPDQLTSLTSVLYKFRENKIAICGDIMEMFHQISIREDDQHFQRFLWGGGENEHPDIYIMTVMTFGATCSPCTAHFVKNTNAEAFATEFSRAVRAIKDNHYVDDLMDSVSTEQEAIKLATEIRHIHNQGGFYIRNWVSNSTTVLKALQSQPTKELSMNLNVELGTEKVLGMWWCTSQDSLTFKITSNPSQREILFNSKRPTKREVLRVLMTIFDPLGLIACFLVYVKILLQEIWRSKIEWDDGIKDEEYDKWLKWTSHLSKIEELRIPRCYISSTWGSEIQLHIFVDASENGFAAVAYIRTVRNEQVETALIGAKTRVAPLKALTIPRLELQAALLGARFAKCIVDSHRLALNRKFFWSDSRTVLSWLRSDHRRYRQYVAFRVSEILELTDAAEWRWIPTSMNVADEATKWQKPPELKATNRWFNGPNFLKSTVDKWPQETIGGSTVEELKTNFVAIHSTVRENIFRYDEISTWRKLMRSTAYALRFVNNVSTKVKKTSKRVGSLSRKELQIAETALVKEAQNSVYAEEVADLAINRRVEKSSPLFNLNAFLDENHIVRANGRICNKKELSSDRRLPIILPRSHRITTLIITDVHCHFKHQNDETVINTLRQKFYIPHMRSVLKAVKKACPQCILNRARPIPPIMAPLPRARLASFCRPFSFVGVDYFGPLLVTIGRRIEKRWGVLLTCLTIRAVHIEVAHSLTTDSCILCLRNFMARRGTPLEFYSDNGTNFIGAERELREAAANIQKDRLLETFNSSSTQWKFIPPGSPHMGGSWERLVRSIKTVLYSSMPSRHPNDELLCSMLIESENIVNSRPLTYIPIDPANPEALTPNHFLLGSPCGSKPPTELDDDAVILRKNWLTSQQFADRFWKRWVAEYLPTLSRRTKWFAPAKPLEVGDIVIIVDPNSPRNSWPKGRIVKVKLSKDNQVRSAFIQTTKGVYERPAVKLAVLDIRSPPNTCPGETTGGEC